MKPTCYLIFSMDLGPNTKSLVLWAIPFPPPKVMPSATTEPSPPLADPLCTGTGGGAEAIGCGGLRGGERVVG
ncbi:unnamed protein product [Ilex paraguariensis]|uniref:Uncharacterized protein n=1 Tax=Ilex paraguariensis TaxID=185542 RepID=A0ABC8SJH8_9AQUA